MVDYIIALNSNCLQKIRRISGTVFKKNWGKNNGSTNQVFRENLKNSPIKTTEQGKNKRGRPIKTWIKRTLGIYILL